MSATCGHYYHAGKKANGDVVGVHMDGTRETCALRTRVAARATERTTRKRTALDEMLEASVTYVGVRLRKEETDRGPVYHLQMCLGGKWRTVEDCLDPEEAMDIAENFTAGVPA